MKFDYWISFLVHVYVQMDAFDFEEEEMLMETSVKNPKENLFDFLYKLKLHHRHPEIARMFSCQVNMEHMIMSCRSYLIEKEQEFFHLTGDSGNGGFLIKDSKFVHIINVFPVGALRNKFNSQISKVPEDKKIFAYKCVVHN